MDVRGCARKIELGKVMVRSGRWNMFYDKESDFEDDLVAVLKRHGWTDGVLEYPTEQDLIDNWANILFDNTKASIA